jgi:lipid II:glycine glycyltransferase (peptidoglycan interpeptide bridge formation enzyme)
MHVREIYDKMVWETFSLSTTPNNFLQSWGWGEFNREIGKQIFRLGVYENDKLMGIALVLVQPTKLGNYLYIPRGPIVKNFTSELLQDLTSHLLVLAKDNNCTFIKIEPSLEETPENEHLFDKLGYQRAVTFTQVEDAWLVDLSKSEEELLEEMRKTTRYLVRNEPKQGVTIEISESYKDAEAFVEMLYSTSARKNFVNHPKEYYLKQFEILAKDDEMRLLKSLKDGKVQAMALVSFYGEMASYLHGASVETEGQSVGYSLQWEAILEAKRRGMRYYNFWGVVKDRNFYPGHPWYGFSLFKRGFGGKKFTYLRAQDLPLSPKYLLYRNAEKLRRLKNRVQTGHWED